tara:strand:- start:915 stop:1127 length:213 start_codon:yes stop_codon:yes gene_type:complete
MWLRKYNNKQKGKTMTKKKIVDWSIVINYDEDNSWGVVDSTNNPVEIIHQNQLDDHILASVDSYLHEIKN